MNELCNAIGHSYADYGFEYKLYGGNREFTSKIKLHSRHVKNRGQGER